MRSSSFLDEKPLIIDVEINVRRKATFAELFILYDDIFCEFSCAGWRVSHEGLFTVCSPPIT